jgi:hypothetical protein
MSTTLQTLYGTYNSDQLKAIKSAIDEVNVSQSKIDYEKQLQKEIIDIAFDNFKIPKKILARMAKVKYKQNYSTEVAEQKEFEALFEVLSEVK